MNRYIIAIVLFLLPNISFAENLVVDLSDQFISIDTSFTGKSLLLFGTKNTDGEVFVAVRGPKKNYLVRKKARKLGIWVNTKQQQFDDVASYFSFASEPNKIDTSNNSLIKELGLSSHGFMPDNVSTDKYREFKEAFSSKFDKLDLYNSDGLDLELIRDTLFKVEIYFPKTVTSGTYLAETYLLKDGQILALQTTPIIIEKVGFDAFIYKLAYEHSFLYGILGIFIAISAGYIAGNYFRKT